MNYRRKGYKQLPTSFYDVYERYVLWFVGMPIKLLVVKKLILAHFRNQSQTKSVLKWPIRKLAITMRNISLTIINLTSKVEKNLRVLSFKSWSRVGLSFAKFNMFLFIFLVVFEFELSFNRINLFYTSSSNSRAVLIRYHT